MAKIGSELRRTANCAKDSLTPGAVYVDGDGDIFLYVDIGDGCVIHLEDFYILERSEITGNLVKIAEPEDVCINLIEKPNEKKCR